MVRRSRIPVFFALLALPALSPPGAPAQGCSGPAASPPAGPLCGATDTVTVAGGSVAVNEFLGIPYARPPVGALRWQPPQAMPEWTSPLQATEFGSICPQFAEGSTSAWTGSEDCLYLNVWQPAGLADPDPVPVMVFIHGGAFIEGAGSLGLYDGGYLAASGGVVVVTLNYRLGPFGFLYADTLGIEGNLGLRDQQLALEWVRDNVSAFGGDPTRVTVFGESAGAMSTGLHLFSIPSSAPLFHAAIMESNLMALQYRGTAEAREDGASFVGTLCRLAGRDPCAASLDWLQSLGTEQVMQADSVYSGGLYEALRLIESGLPEVLAWTPAVDGTFVTGQPSVGYAEGMPPKPYVFGMNLNEGALFAAELEQAAGPLGLAVVYEGLLDLLFAFNGPRIQSYTTGTGYQPYSQTMDSTTSVMDHTELATSEVLTDALFACGALASADSALTVNADSLPVYGYLFLQPPFFDLLPTVDVCTPAAANVCHTYELPYVFSTLAYAAEQPGSGQPTVADSALARAMSAAWTAFARDPLSPPADGWTAYTPNGSLYVWGGADGGTMRPGWSAARNCPQLWYTIPPLGS